MDDTPSALGFHARDGWYFRRSTSTADAVTE